MNPVINYSGNAKATEPLCSVTRTVMPFNETNWANFIDMNDIVMISANQDSKFRMSRVGKVSSAVHGLPIVIVNAYMHETFQSKLKDKLKAAAVGDYANHIDLAFDVAKEWTVGGICASAPDPDVDMHVAHNIVTHIQGRVRVQNIWPAQARTGDTLYLKLQMVKVDKNTKYWFSHTCSHTPPHVFEDAIDAAHYVPQFVALYSARRVAVPFGLQKFEMDGKQYMGRLYLIGTCVTNDAYIEHFEKKDGGQCLIQDAGDYPNKRPMHIMAQTS